MRRRGRPISQRRSRRSDAASNAGSPTSGFGSIASQSPRRRRTLPPWKSWWRTTSSASGLEGAAGLHRELGEPPWIRPASRLPVGRDRLLPPGGGVREQSETMPRATGTRMKPPEHTGSDPCRRGIVCDLPERSPRIRALEQHRAAPGSWSRSRTAPRPPSGRGRPLRARSPSRERELQNGGRPVVARRRDDECHGAAGERLARRERPPLTARLDRVGSESSHSLPPGTARHHSRSAGILTPRRGGRRRSRSCRARVEASGGAPVERGAGTPATPRRASRRARPRPRTRRRRRRPRTPPR